MNSDIVLIGSCVSTFLFSQQLLNSFNSIKQIKKIGKYGKETYSFKNIYRIPTIFSNKPEHFQIVNKEYSRQNTLNLHDYYNILLSNKDNYKIEELVTMTTYTYITKTLGTELAFHFFKLYGNRPELYTTKAFFGLIRFKVLVNSSEIK